MPNARMLLIYMNWILYKDESSIDCIGDGDFVIIIENIYYLDNRYYNSLNNQNYSGNIKNVSLEINGKTINMIVPSDTKLFQLYKAFILNFGCGFKFFYNGKDINEQDERDFLEGLIIKFHESNIMRTYIHILGKEINLTIDFIDNTGKKRSNFPTYYVVGIYNSIKEFTHMIDFKH